MTNGAAEERWLEALRYPLPRASWAEVFAMVGSPLGPGEIVALACRARLAGPHPVRPRRDGVQSNGAVTLLRLPAPEPADQLARLVEAANAWNRKRGVPDRLAFLRLEGKARRGAAFLSHVERQLTGGPAAPRHLPAETRDPLDELALLSRLARVGAWFVERAERADEDLRLLFGRWLARTAGVPGLVLGFTRRHGQTLVTNVPPPSLQEVHHVVGP